MNVFYYNYMNFKNLKLIPSFLKVAKDNYKRKTSFSMLSLMTLDKIYKEQKKKVKYLIIYKNKDVLTTSRILYSGKNGYINFVRTNKKFRGMGLCKRNIRKLISLSTKELKLNKFTLNVERGNIYAIKCYKKIGFEILNSNETEDKMIYIK